MTDSVATSSGPSSGPKNAPDVAADHAVLRDVSAAHFGRAPTRIESMLAGLGTRRFHRLYFERDASLPATVVARFEAEDSAAPAVPGLTPPAWLPEPPLEPLRTFLADGGIPVWPGRTYLAELEPGNAEIHLEVSPAGAEKVSASKLKAFLKRK